MGSARAGRQEWRDLLSEVREELLPDTSGEPDEGAGPSGTGRFSLAVADAHDGADPTAVATEDADVAFALQSVVKPWMYAVALADHGDLVHERIGVEPTGEPFDALVMESETGRPPNAMVNAGALVTASLVDGASVADRVERIRDVCSRAAGRELEVDEQLASREVQRGDRNRALGYLMRSSGALDGEVEEALEVLARACAITVTAPDLAQMGATLARWGRGPGDEEVLPTAVVTEVLSVMATCGMYDGAGRWVHRVGMPAKSGVSGALMAVAPGVLGLGAFSTPLDDHGNSVRGVRACEELSQRLGLHRFSPPT